MPIVRELRSLAEARKDADLKTIAERALSGLASGGRIGMLTNMLETRRALFARGRVSAYSVAEVLAFLNDRNGALAWLATSLDRNEPEITGMKINPVFAALHDGAGFQQLLKKARL